jgi:anaerobic C4-dicarboxylate transporter
VRSVFFQRTTRVNEGLREFKKQANLAVSIFLFLIVCVVVFAAGKLVWTWWWSSL